MVRSLGREDPLEEGMAIHSNILACRILWTEEPGGLQSIRSHTVDMTEVTQHAQMHICISEVIDISPGNLDITTLFLPPKI